ncbi:repressor LexA [Candidatus Dojkabacteria bacterium]|nr:repressor LexA [Candidatus Dojkabacteria bacterium]
MATLLTNRQKEVLDIIAKYFKQQDQAPTLNELKKELNIGTKRGVVNHLTALEKKGFIRRSSKPRGIQIINQEDSDFLFINIPILGYANAGEPLAEAEEEFIGEIKIDKNLIPKNKNLFSIIIKGDSMNKRKVGKIRLENGKIAVIERNAHVENNDVILAIVENQATIKTYKKSDNAVILYPESTNKIHKPIYLKPDSQFIINGKVIKILENPAYRNL